METFKASVRYGVLMFVMAGAIISLAGLDTRISASESVSVEKPQSPGKSAGKEYTQPSRDLLSAEAG